MSDLTFKLRRREITLSQGAANLLDQLCELEDAGLVRANVQVLTDAGYDEGSSQVDVPATVTFEGREVLKHLRKT